jgi:hypothetical protein
MTHPWLADVEESRSTRPSDADPRSTGVVELGSGALHLVPAPGSLAESVVGDHIPLTTARSSGTAATRNAQAYGEFGAAHEGPHEVTKVRI